MSEPENYVKKEEPRVSIKQRRKKSIGGKMCIRDSAGKTASPGYDHPARQ